MQLHKLTCSSLSLHAVPFFVSAAHKNFAVLVVVETITFLYYLFVIIIFAKTSVTPRTFMLNHACLNCMANNNSKKITINLKEKEDVKSVTMKISK